MDDVSCKLCDFSAPYLGDHLYHVHGLTGEQYLHQFPGAPTVSRDFLTFARPILGAESPTRKAPNLQGLKVKIAGSEFNPDFRVPKEACLLMPDFYRIPTHGKLAEAIQQVAVALTNGRSSYVWGLPGSGKDAFFHYVSATVRRPGLIRSIKPGVNLQAWFYSRTIGAGGTDWEVGPLFKALTEGYEVRNPDGSTERVPYIILFSDLDRADRSQTEHLRMILDTIEGRVEGPGGVMHRVLPGTTVVATGNSAGGGDERGRCISSNPIDASILDRFDRKFEFPWLEWEDEVVVVRQKFPLLAQRQPQFLSSLGNAARTVRDAIRNEQLYGELTHRGICAILGHAEDMLRPCPENIVPNKLALHSVSVWTNGLGDSANRQKALELLNPFFANSILGNGTLPTSNQPSWNTP